MTPLNYDPAASFTITRSFLSADVTRDVNGWLAEPSTQYGWAFKNTGADAYKFLTYQGAAEEAGEQYCEDSGFTEEQCLANDASSPCECDWIDGEDPGDSDCIWAGIYGEGGKCGAADGVNGRGPKLLLVAHDCPSTATPLATRTFSSPGCATESFEITSSVATELLLSGVLRDQLSSIAAHHPRPIPAQGQQTAGPDQGRAGRDRDWRKGGGHVHWTDCMLLQRRPMRKRRVLQL